MTYDYLPGDGVPPCLSAMRRLAHGLAVRAGRGRVLRSGVRRADPAGVVAGHHTCLSQVCMAEAVRHRGANGIR
jgi:hypothetical protein